VDVQPPGAWGLHHLDLSVVDEPYGGAFTGNVLIRRQNATTGDTPEAGDVVVVKASVQADPDATVKFYDDSTGGALLHTLTGHPTREIDHVLRFRFNGTAWALVSADALAGTVWQTVFLPKTAFKQWTANQAPEGTLNSSNQIELEVWDFDNASHKFIHALTLLPDGYDYRGKIKARAHWLATDGTTGSVVVNVEAKALLLGAAWDANVFPVGPTTGVYMTDAFAAQKQIMETPVSSELTIHNAGERPRLLSVRVGRDLNNAADTFNGTLRLLGLELFFPLASKSDL